MLRGYLEKKAPIAEFVGRGGISHASLESVAYRYIRASVRRRRQSEG